MLLSLKDGMSVKNARAQAISPIETNRKKGILSRGSVPFLTRKGIIQNSTNQPRGRSEAGATIVLPANFDRNGRLVIGSNKIIPAQAILSVESNSRRRTLGMFLFPLETCYPEGDHESHNGSGEDESPLIVNNGFVWYRCRFRERNFQD